MTLGAATEHRLDCPRALQLIEHALFDVRRRALVHENH
jgi:hypothetical protein